MTAQRALEALIAFATTNSELGRQFAHHMHMHHTDAAAIIEIIAAEHRDQPLTPARLAERISLSTGATSILLNRLEDAGHIVRTREHQDRRIVTLHSTPSINAAAETYYAPLNQQLAAVLSEYSPATLAALEEVAGRLRSVTNSHIDGSA